VTFGSRIVDWYRVRWAANPFSVYALLAALLAALFMALVWLDIQRDLALLAARAAGVILLIECVRLARRPRNPLPSDAAPLVTWTSRRRTFVAVVLLAALTGALIGIGFVVPR
jgi:hypothetical protein